MGLFLDKAFSWDEMLFTDRNSPPLMPDEDNNVSGSLVFDFRNDDVSCSTRIEISARYTLFQ